MRINVIYSMEDVTFKSEKIKTKYWGWVEDNECNIKGQIEENVEEWLNQCDDVLSLVSKIKINQAQWDICKGDVYIGCVWYSVEFIV